MAANWLLFIHLAGCNGQLSNFLPDDLIAIKHFIERLKS